VIGDSASGQPATAATVADPRTPGSQRTLVLPTPRAGHTATVLPDGTVLVYGGTGLAEQVLGAPEVFDPASLTFVPLSMDGAVPRTGHTATLLTDGRLLVAGGIGADGAPPPAEIWDLNSSTAVAVASELARIGHDATLLADGRVLLTHSPARAGSCAGTATKSTCDSPVGTSEDVPYTGSYRRPSKRRLAICSETSPTRNTMTASMMSSTDEFVTWLCVAIVQIA
jgi:hypothetical protein